MEMKVVSALILGLVIGVIVGGAVGAFVLPQQVHSFFPSTLNTSTNTSTSTNTITPEAAGAKTIDFISNYGGLPPGVNVTLINVTEAEDADLYKIAVNMSAGGISRTVMTYLTKDGKILFPQGIDIEEVESRQTKETVTRTRQTIGNFIVSGDEICKDDGKPAIYFFGSDGCPHCKWEHPVIADVASKFKDFISFHDDMNNFTADRDIFARYSTGGVPTIVLGCRYYRIGSGENQGKEQEAKILTALICNLTDNKPIDICSTPEIEALIARI